MRYSLTITMIIRTDGKNFVPKHFLICNFYGKDTCFAWASSNEFVTFPYIYQEQTPVLQVLKAPDKIKDIRGVNGRIFILCFPQGVYKLTEKFEFAVLSKTGLELLSKFSVLSLNDGNLILKDKASKKAVKLLLTSTISDIHVYSLQYNTTDTSIYKAIVHDEIKNDVSVCLLAVDKKLFTLVHETVHLIYESDHLIKNIKSFERDKLVFGVVLETDSDALVFIHAMDNKLIYDLVFLGGNFETICPILCADKKVLLVHSDSEKTCYSIVSLTTNSIRQVKVKNRSFLDIKMCQSNFTVFLNRSGNLHQIPIEEMRNLCIENTCDYVGLQSNMMKGLESVIDTICEKTSELKILRQDMLHKEDCLKRINMYVNKQTIKYCPSDSVLRLSNNLFLTSNFKRNLFENCTVIKVLKSGGKMIYLMKDTRDYDTIVEMPINLTNLSSRLCTSTDLITYKNYNGIWCLIKDYVQDPLPSKSNSATLSNEQLNIVKYNLVVLKNLISKNKLSMESLAEIKRKIRNEIEL